MMKEAIGELEETLQKTSKDLGFITHMIERVQEGIAMVGQAVSPPSLAHARTHTRTCTHVRLTAISVTLPLTHSLTHTLSHTQQPTLPLLTHQPLLDS